MYIIDTNIISNFLLTNGNYGVTKWFDDHHPSDLYLTSITAGELFYGLNIMPTGKKRKNLTLQVDALLTHRYKDRILPYDLNAARYLGEYLSACKKKGIAVSPNDSKIAAIALSCGAKAIVTRDEAPFSAMSLKTINPWKE